MMVINPARYVQNMFSHARILELYQDLRSYLPRKRLNEFMRSWVVNNLILGPGRRARFERKHGCTLPGLINISPSQKCNLNCVGCYAADYSRSAEMTTAQFAHIVGEAKKLGINLIGILGGEPFFRKDLFGVIESNKDMAFRISTNGTVIDGEIIGSLGRCGNLVTFISLEGFPDDTDAWRGSGVFGTIAETMARLRRERLLFGFSATVHARNSESVVSREFLDAMQDAGCRFGIFFPYGPAGSRARFDLALDEQQVNDLYDRITDLQKDYIMVLRKEGYAPRDTPGDPAVDQGCRAGITIHITPEGFVEPCNGIQFYAENVFEKDLGSVLRSSFYRDIFSCVREHGSRCVAMNHPEAVLRVVERHRARGSHALALPSYTEYARQVASRNAGAQGTTGVEATKEGT